MVLSAVFPAAVDCNSLNTLLNLVFDNPFNNAAEFLGFFINAAANCFVVITTAGAAALEVESAVTALDAAGYAVPDPSGALLRAWHHTGQACDQDSF